MKRIWILIVFVVIASALCFAQQADKYTLTVKITGIKSARGTMNGYLFSSEETFLKEPFMEVSTEVTNDESINIIFENVPAGIYAVNVHQDINDNDEFDTNWMRVPKEPYGFSNNPKTLMGPPSFEKAQIEINSDTIISIKIK